MHSVAAIGVLILLGGCASAAPRVVYIPVPDGYLEPCDVPNPANINQTYDLEDAYIRAHRCAVQGNTDKARIRALAKEVRDGSDR